ncbi:MAG TPA: hypothetical protein ENK43_09950 [Planctomycetes bacterium]|nr:hypothetical protein [Planctomycetota bacterium]
MNRRRDDSSDRVLVDFLLAYHEDMARGASRTLGDYLRSFPGHEDEVAWEFVQLKLAQASRDDDGRAVGPFTLIEELGRGGQGVVYLAEDVRLGRRVALKVLNLGGRKADDVLVRFRREAEVGARLGHPNICTVYEVGQSEGTAWIAMEYVEGESLSALIKRDVGCPDRETVTQRLRLIETVARALHVAHEAGVIHRDIKPGNIMIRMTGEPVILDFGLARDERTAQPDLTRTGAVFGTPSYMSPEQLAGATTPLDRRTDIYSLGVTLFQAVTGQRPFDRSTTDALVHAVLNEGLPNPRRINSAISGDLAQVLRTACESDLNRRYASALSLAEEIRCVLEHRPIQARPLSWPSKLARWRRRNPRLALSLASLALALVALAGLAVYSARTEKALRLDVERNWNDRRRTADLKRVRDLEHAYASDLWPMDSDFPNRASGWIEEATAVLARREDDERALRAMGPPPWEDVETAFFGALLTELTEGLPKLEEKLKEVERRKALCSSLAAKSLGDERWRPLRNEGGLGDAYPGLTLAPQWDLVPLRRNPTSRLWEFWLVSSGDEPRLDSATGRWVMKPETGLVMVLVPGAEFLMGAAEDEPGERDERPAQVVRLEPYFISAFEVTQAQWMRYHDGANPSYYYPGKTSESGESFSLIHPVEFMDHDAAVEAARRMGLRLPTEAQWEYACRAGTRTLWSCGSDVEDLGAFANFAGQECPKRLQSRNPAFALHKDRHVIHAPVGSYEPNGFGLFDMHGNVWEWCAERYARSYEGVAHRPGDGREIPEGTEPIFVIRGGGFAHPASMGRSSDRNLSGGAAKHRDLGFRPVRSIEPTRGTEKK